MDERVRRAKARVGDAQQNYDTQKAWLDNRSLYTRANDATSFFAGIPIRALTGGEYGADSVNEANFARANPGAVRWLNHLAGVGLGIPELRTMGHVEGGINALVNAPQEAKRAAPDIMGPLSLNEDLAARSAAPAPATQPRNALAPEALVGPQARLDSIQDFRDANIPVFAPSLASKGIARTARTVEELPLIGGTVKTPKTAVELAAAAEQARIADELGAVSSKDDAGLIVQSGLQRFRTAGMQDLERQRLQQLGVSPDRPASATPAGTLRIDRPSQLDTSSMSPAELATASSARVTLPQTARSGLEDLSNVELNRIIDAPANETSFAVKQGALYERASRAMPDIMRENDSRNPNLFAQRESASVVNGLIRQQDAAGVRGGALEGRFGPLIERISNPRANMTIENMRAARTEVGRALAEGNDLDKSMSRTQLKQLYGALTNDIERALVGVAARARIRANAGELPVEVANQADSALHYTRVADRYTRAGLDRMDRFTNVMNANSIEQAAQRFTSYLKDNTQNAQAAETIASALRPEELRSVIGHVVQNLGQLTPGAREAERVFSFERFATDFNKLSQSPRVMRVFEQALGPEHVASLQRLARIAERMKYYETTRNYSGSAYAGAGIAGAGAMFSPSTILPLVGSFLAMGGAGKLLTSQGFSRWLETVYGAELAGRSKLNALREGLSTMIAPARNAASDQLASLKRAASSEPDPNVSALMRVIANSIEATQGEPRTPPGLGLLGAAGASASQGNSSQ